MHIPKHQNTNLSQIFFPVPLIFKEIPDQKTDSNRTENPEEFTHEISFKDKNNSTKSVLLRWFSKSHSS